MKEINSATALESARDRHYRPGPMRDCTFQLVRRIIFTTPIFPPSLLCPIDMEAPVFSADEAEDLTKQAIISVAAKDIDATFKSGFIGMVHSDAVHRTKALILPISRSHLQTAWLADRIMLR